MLSRGRRGVKIIPTEFPAKWIEEVFKAKDYDMTIVAHTEPLDIDIYGRDTYYFNYKNDAFRALIAEIAETPDEAARFETYKAGREDPGRGRAGPVPVPAAEARRVERQAEGPVGELAHPVERRDRGALGGLAARRRRVGFSGPPCSACDTAPAMLRPSPRPRGRARPDAARRLGRDLPGRRRAARRHRPPSCSAPRRARTRSPRCGPSSASTGRRSLRYLAWIARPRARAISAPPSPTRCRSARSSPSGSR